MTKRRAILTAVLVFGSVAALLIGKSVVRGQGTATWSQTDASDEQVSGPYLPVVGWPKPLATLWPDEKGWTWGSTQAILVPTTTPCTATPVSTRS